MPTETTYLMAGNSLPPSPWRLDHVPGRVLDMIVDHLASWAIDEHDCGRPMCHFDRDYPGGNDFIPWSRDLESVSVVSHQFRESVFHRKVLSNLMVDSPEEAEVIKEKLSEHSLTYVKHIVIPDFEPLRTLSSLWHTHCSELFALIALCTNLKSIRDESGCIAYHHSFAPSVIKLDLVLRHGDALPIPIRTPKLRQLCIASDMADRLESEFKCATDHFPGKVRVMLGSITSLDTLSLQLPGCRMPGGHDSRRLPPAYRTQNPLPESLKEVRTLEIKIPYCTVDAWTPREGHWWGYLRWVFDTAPRFTNLIISLDWNVGYTAMFPELYDQSPTGILQSMSLQLVKVDSLFGRAYLHGDATTQDMKDFLGDMLHDSMRTGLERIELSYKAMTQALAGRGLPVRFRSVVATKLANGQPETGCTKYEDVIDIEMVNTIIEDGMGVLLNMMPTEPTPVRNPLYEGLPLYIQEIFAIQDSYLGPT